ncbi:MAG TPA: invasion associated locus B family protein [Xanthobacteraceae bacterium]|nr:invasion associated locus B family protein [Xanthobacteraceae bacterium]
MPRSRRPIVFSLALLIGCAAFAGEPRAQGEGQPSLVGQYGSWGVYAGKNNGHKICFALAQPESSQTDPPNRPRDPIYLFVSTRPADNVREEVSVIVGYPLRRGTDASAEIDGAKFDLMTQDDNAWVKNAADEPRLVEAMRKGSKMIVRGVSTRGTKTTDNFSLTGVSQALDRVAQECR